jgi:hypothetical protein
MESECSQEQIGEARPQEWSEILGNGIKSGFEGVDIEGKPFRSEWSGKCDGNEGIYPTQEARKYHEAGRHAAVFRRLGEGAT